MRNYILGSIVLMLCTACQEESNTTNFLIANSDKELVGRVLEALQQSIAFEEIEKFVQVPSVLNMAKEVDRALFDRMNLNLEQEPASEIMDIKEFYQLSETYKVVYSIRPIETRHTRIVGLVWTKNNKPKIFFAVVFPP